MKLNPANKAAKLQAVILAALAIAALISAVVSQWFMAGLHTGALIVLLLLSFQDKRYKVLTKA